MADDNRASGGGGRIGEFFINPDAVSRRVQTLDDAWQSLGRIAKTNDYITAEIAAWIRWKNAVLKSKVSLWYSSATLAELEQWVKRYETAYAKAGELNGELEAPSPAAFHSTSFLDVFKPSPGNSAWLYLALGASAVALGIAIFSRD